MKIGRHHIIPILAIGWLLIPALCGFGADASGLSANAYFSDHQSEFMPEPDPPKVELKTSIPRIATSLRDAGSPTVEWTYHKTADNTHPNGNEQQLVWLMNRARSEPTTEGIWLATVDDTNIAMARSYFNLNLDVLQSEFAAIQAKPPAAFMSGFTSLPKRIQMT